MKKEKVTEKMVHKAIEVILSDKKSYPTSLNWAVNYCLGSQIMDGKDLRTQVIYILGNITHWRHPEAKRVREVLKSFVKEE